MLPNHVLWHKMIYLVKNCYIEVGFSSGCLFYCQTEIYYIMKKVTLQCILFLAVACTTLLSCQNEENEVSQPNPENLTKDSALTGLLRRVTTTDSISDNLVDSTSCFRLKQPYQVLVHDGGTAVGLEYNFTVTDAASQQQLNDIITGFADTSDHISLYFPVTAQFADGTETVIHNTAELNTARMQCDPAAGTSTDPITCVNINYPITIFSYNANFQVAETYTIESDAQLIAMLSSVMPGQFFAINFPVSLTLSDGSVLTANNNEQLAGIIEQAITLCSTPVINPCNNTNVLINGLVIYMPIAGEARDLISGENAINALNYPPVFVADRDGNAQGAVSFSGNNYDSLRLLATDSNNFEVGDSLTISLWYRSLDTDNGNFEHLFEKSPNEDTANAFGIALYDLNRPLFYGADNFNVWDPFFGSDNNWHHLVIVSAATTISNEIKMYKDGQLAASGSAGNFLLNTQVFDYYFGRGFKGTLDDIRVYRRALSANEVQTLYNLPADVFHCVN